MRSAEQGATDAGLDALIARWSGLRVVVVGDVMLDEDRVGRVDRMSPEAPVPIVRIAAVRNAPGGAANVARNVLSLGARCELFGVVGDDEEGDRLRAELGAIGLDPAGLICEAGRPTTHKLRIVTEGRQMMRLDREVTRAVAPRDALLARVGASLPGCDLLVLQDYDKGVFADGLAAELIGRARRAGVPVMVDPKHRIERFRGASLLKPNLAEARALVEGFEAAMLAGEAEETVEARRRLLEKLQARLGGGEIVVTRGAEGMSALDAAGHFVDVPTRARAVYDVQGAGDTAMAALALARAAGSSLAEACIVANAAASLAVGKVGTAAVSAEELRAGGDEAMWAVHEAAQRGRA